ncbi:MAG: YigZ family protein [Candidatus Delongbacteria bacterium]|nr:YigZ family protein [Candidatus Delongbacteria bacterium]MCG2760621.1 YigZ family protein [Candidatus Delongbacteria bacterium]
MEKELYTTIKKNAEKEIEKVKGSRFIGRLIKATDRENAEAELEMIRKKYYNATHNCFAYTVGMNDQIIIRSSDDGEPSGTAGKPILTVIEGSGLSNVLLVVTRYYGGTNLGTGGLIKAYTGAAKEVIEAAEKEIIEIKKNISFSYCYDMTNLAMNIINKYEGMVVSTEFHDFPRVKISINKGYETDFKNEIFDRSNGAIKVELC